MAKGQLPKAYLRLDPDIDHKHPDNLDGFVRLLCAANRQVPRGRFRARAVIDSLFGKSGTDRFYRRGDIANLPDGSVEVVGWDYWQEGDLTVAQRMKAYRSRKSPVTRSVTDGVTPTVTPPSPERIGPSEASRRQGVKASDVLSDALPPPHDEWDQPELEAVGWLARHGCALSETNGLRRRLIGHVERSGVNAVVGAFDRLVEAGIVDGDARGFIFGLDDLLFPKADIKALEREERAEEQRDVVDARYHATMRMLARQRGESA